MQQLRQAWAGAPHHLAPEAEVLRVELGEAIPEPRQHVRARGIEALEAPRTADGDTHLGQSGAPRQALVATPSYMYPKGFGPFT
jgi:hypothetical protein